MHVSEKETKGFKEEGNIMKIRFILLNLFDENNSWNSCMYDVYRMGSQAIVLVKMMILQLWWHMVKSFMMMEVRQEIVEDCCPTMQE